MVKRQTAVQVEHKATKNKGRRIAKQQEKVESAMGASLRGERLVQHAVPGAKQDEMLARRIVGERIHPRADLKHACRALLEAGRSAP